MATNKFAFFIVAFALMLSPLAYAGQVVSLSGQVVDQDTGDPLPYAHVFVKDIGTVTNVGGYFNLAVDESMLSYELKASYIGYKSTNISLKDEQDLNKIVVKMAAVSLELEGVQVRSGDMILQKVINRIDFNYEYSHQSALCFFRETLDTQFGKQYVAEGIMDIYLPNNYSNNDIQVSVVKSRKSTFESELAEDFTMIKGHAMDMVQSIVWRDDSFLNKKKRKHYDFTYDGVTMYNEKEVLIVKFWPKTRKGRFHGQMYVDIESYAIIKVEYFPDTKKSRFWEDVRWTEEFNYRNGRWFLSRVSYEGKWYEYDQVFDFRSMLVVNIVETVDGMPAMGLLIKEDDTFFEEAKKEVLTEEFWKGFSYVELDEETSSY